MCLCARLLINMCAALAMRDARNTDAIELKCHGSKAAAGNHPRREILALRG